MISPFAVFGFLNARFISVFGFSLSPASLAGFVVGWLFARSATAVVGEYAKRFWFRKAFKDSIVREREELEKLKAAIDLERLEYRWAIERVTSLRHENETLLLEVIKLRIELSTMRKADQHSVQPLPPFYSGEFEGPFPFHHDEPRTALKGQPPFSPSGPAADYDIDPAR